VAELVEAWSNGVMEYWSNKVFELLIQNSRFEIRKSTNGSYIGCEILGFELWILKDRIGS
jgi:hypothetical protein